MKITVTKVQEVETQIELSKFYLRLTPGIIYKAIDQNGKNVYFKAQKLGNGKETYVIFENGNLRFNAPAKIIITEAPRHEPLN